MSASQNMTRSGSACERVTGESPEVVQLQLHMPSEHMIDGKSFAAELQVVHRQGGHKTSLFVQSSFPHGGVRVSMASRLEAL